ncbi:hypothetical protein WA158_004069 [Blastocystis sp. Blastoise]
MASNNKIPVFKAGDECIAKLGDKWYPAKVLAVNLVKTDPTQNKYYIHYPHVNRRMDTWLGVKEVAPKEHEKVPEKFEIQGLKIQISDSNVINFIEPEHTTNEGMDEASIREHEEVTKVKNIQSIQIGKYHVETWYFSPFPKECWSSGIQECLYICEYCLSFFTTEHQLERHSMKCKAMCPPGDEIYRHNNLSVFEVDGGGDYAQHIYAQNISYIAKLFLDHKTLFFDVTPFFFYVVCEYDDKGYHVVGYYSKEKYSEQGYNLACIMTLPQYQRKGYGHFLIEFSYALSKVEQKVGSPEKPLSDLGHLSYTSFWKNEIVRILADLNGQMISIIDIAKQTSFTIEDIHHTLRNLHLIQYSNGQHILAVPQELIDKVLSAHKKHKGPLVDMNSLHWEPTDFNPPNDKWSYASLARSE